MTGRRQSNDEYKRKGRQSLGAQMIVTPSNDDPSSSAGSLILSSDQKHIFPARLSTFHKSMASVFAEVLKIPRCTRIGGQDF